MTTAAWVADIGGAIALPGIRTAGSPRRRPCGFGRSRDDNLAQVVGTDAEYDLRLRGFRNLTFGRDTGFVDAQASYRLRAEPRTNFMQIWRWATGPTRISC